ncbi:MAG: hypothetical protein COB76_03175 [Alphaproteobacteria bacterium]|nr:MAG: hypothetical protein COB76_03175 [Alphaproteobacteria bacterium]
MKLIAYAKTIMDNFFWGSVLIIYCLPWFLLQLSLVVIKILFNEETAYEDSFLIVHLLPCVIYFFFYALLFKKRYIDSPVKLVSLFLAVYFIEILYLFLKFSLGYQFDYTEGVFDMIYITVSGLLSYGIFEMKKIRENE